jgi:hypothetical protein
MTCDSGMNTSGQNAIETKIKITMSFYGKRNEITFDGTPHMIMFYLKQQLSLHALLWMIHIVPYPIRLNQLCQHSLRFNNRL